MDRGLRHGWARRREVEATLNQAEFILTNTCITSPAHVPEISLHLASEAHELWLKTEDQLAEIGLPPPFWAFAWAGGQGLARYILDHQYCVAEKRVLDFASGSGLVAIAAKMAGASEVTANDIDPFCETACRLNSGLNHVSLSFTNRDLLALMGENDGLSIKSFLHSFDCLLAGDIFYDAAMAKAALPLLQAFAAAGKPVLIGDPGRAYLPKQQLVQLAQYEVPTTLALEDTEIKRTTVWKFSAAIAS